MMGRRDEVIENGVFGFLIRLCLFFSFYLVQADKEFIGNWLLILRKKRYFFILFTGYIFGGKFSNM